MFGLKELLLTGALFAVGAVLSVIFLKKATGNKRLLLIPAAIIFIVIAASFVLFSDLPSTSAENGEYSVLSSGSGYSPLSLEITDAEAIRSISDLAEELKPAIGIRRNQNGSHYRIRFYDAKGASILEVTVVSESQIQVDTYIIKTDTTALIARLDALFQ